MNRLGGEGGEISFDMTSVNGRSRDADETVDFLYTPPGTSLYLVVPHRLMHAVYIRPTSTSLVPTLAVWI
jgi:hypothetical protein